MTTITVAFCTFKRANRLEKLVAKLREQSCPVPFEILAINNNSPDNTLTMLASLQKLPGPPLRVVTEMAAGIVPARNRAIEEALNSNSDVLVFIDDDELPEPGWLAAAYDSITNEHADCVGGRILIDFFGVNRPAWLDDEIAGFLGQLDHGQKAFWIKNTSTPIWSGNIAYATSIFRDDSTLRFDSKYNRSGLPMGGGEDQMMFHRLIVRGAKLFYRPDMTILHGVEDWRLHRRYFLKLHFLAGQRKGLHELPDYPSSTLGAPPFLFRQAFMHSIRATQIWLFQSHGALRQAMNVAHAFGLIKGYRQRQKAAPHHD